MSLLTPKVIAGLVLAALLAGIGWRVMAWRTGYLERDAAVAAQAKAESDLVDYQKQVAAQAKQQAAAIAEDDASKAALAQRQADAQQSLAAIAARPVQSVVLHDKVQPDGSRCPDPRIGPDWLQSWNDTAAAGSPAKPTD